MVKNKLIALTFYLFLFSGCGFEVIKISELNNFYINDIETTGDKRVSYEIRNDLISVKKNTEKKLINLELNSNKTKTIKEKNIKNEITKYEMKLTVEVTIYDEKYDIIQQFTETSKSSYNVQRKHSLTLDVEKKQIKFLSKKISDNILVQLRNIQ